jgi:hypothetical protein
MKYEEIKKYGEQLLLMISREKIYELWGYKRRVFEIERERIKPEKIKIRELGVKKKWGL